MKTLKPANVMQEATQKCGMLFHKLQGFVLGIKKIIHWHHCDNKDFFSFVPLVLAAYRALVPPGELMWNRLH